MPRTLEADLDQKFDKIRNLPTELQRYVFALRRPTSTEVVALQQLDKEVLLQYMLIRREFFRYWYALQDHCLLLAEYQDQSTQESYKVMIQKNIAEIIEYCAQHINDIQAYVYDGVLPKETLN